MNKTKISSLDVFDLLHEVEEEFEFSFLRPMRRNRFVLRRLLFLRNREKCLQRKVSQEQKVREILDLVPWTVKNLKLRQDQRKNMYRKGDVVECALSSGACVVGTVVRIDEGWDQILLTCT